MDIQPTHNPTQQPDGAEGGGASTAGGKFRSEMRLYLRAVREGWEVPDAVRKAAIARTARVLANPNARARDVARAARTVLDIDRLRMDALAQEDKAERLERGEPTEITGILTPEQIRAVALTYHATTAQLPALPDATAGTGGPAAGAGVPDQPDQRPGGALGG